MIERMTEELAVSDWLLLALIFVWVPLQELAQMKLTRRSIAHGVPRAKLAVYTQSILQLWSLAGAVLLVWALEDRNWAELGFRFDGDRADWIVIGVACLVTAYLLYLLAQVMFSGAVRQQYRDAVRTQSGGTYFLPSNGKEYRRFSLLGTTAGITEEIIFRGYLIWVLSLMLPLPAAAIVAIAIFTLLHLYQGVGQLPAVAIAGTGLTIMYVYSGSLYPVIALHIAIDVIMATIWRVALREHAQAPAGDEGYV